jgi:tetratricopeptide (TPR) repeat protein
VTAETVTPVPDVDDGFNPNNLSSVVTDGEKAKVHLNKGRQLEVAGDHEGAIREYRLAAATDGDLAWAWGEMSYSLNKLEKYRYGIIAARKCIDIGGADKMLGACYFDLGFAQEMLGNKVQAISAYEKSLENRPGHDYVMKRLADLRGGQ